MLTKAELRQKIINLFEGNGLFGRDAELALIEFMEKEKICPSAIDEAMFVLANENHQLSDGRVFAHGPSSDSSDLRLSEQFSNELWACKHLHTGGIQCPKQ